MIQSINKMPWKSFAAGALIGLLAWPLGAHEIAASALQVVSRIGWPFVLSPFLSLWLVYLAVGDPERFSCLSNAVGGFFSWPFTYSAATFCGLAFSASASWLMLGTDLLIATSFLSSLFSAVLAFIGWGLRALSIKPPKSDGDDR